MAKKQEGTKREVKPDDLQGIPDVSYEPLKVDNAKVTKKKETREDRLASRTTKMGRPVLFETVEELEEKIQEYFAYCDNRIISVYNKELGDNIQISNPAPYTMSGLALALGVDRKTLLNYGRKEDFFHTINMARATVENNLEERMNDKNTFTPGLIFNLKNNFGWVDKTEVDNKHQVVQPILGGATKNLELEDETE